MLYNIKQNKMTLATKTLYSSIICMLGTRSKFVSISITLAFSFVGLVVRSLESDVFPLLWNGQEP